MRALRKWITSRGRDLALGSAGLLPAWLIGGACAAIRRIVPGLPVIGRNVRRNMAALGVSPSAARSYFRHVADHLEDAMLLWRCARGAEAAPMPPAVRQRVESRISLDPSIDRLAEQCAARGGAVLLGPHVCGFLVSMARLRQRLPLTVYLRYSSDARKRRLKEQWCRLTGLEYVAEQTRPADAMTRMRRMVELVQSGRVLYLTPDLPQEAGAGKAVRFFGREVYLPPGGPLLALRSRAPLYLLLAAQDGARIRMLATGPYAGADDRSEGSRVQAGIAARLQWFADEFERFVRREPALWYFWADKRWTRLLSGDPRYGRPIDAPSADAAALRPAEAR